MNMIKLTHVTGKPVIVNLASVRTIWPVDNATVIHFTGNDQPAMTVLEAFNDVAALLHCKQVEPEDF